MKLQQELTILIKMVFGLDKYATAIFRHGRQTKPKHYSKEPDSNKEHGA
jgi:hypothetical protein